jgi:cysteine desulfurase/selenocysteine lyase
MSDVQEQWIAKPSAPYDVDAIREDFPILHQTVHGRPLVYLDNGASAQKPNPVIDAISHYYRHDHANVHRGVHTLSQRATDRYEGSREKIRAFINARSVKEVVFVRGTTEAVNLVAQSYGRPSLAAGEEVLITEMEHHSNIVPWQLLCQQTGANLKVVPINDRGELDLVEFERRLSSRTRIFAVTHISNALGTINPLEELIEKAHRAGAVVIVDGAQAVPHMAVDVLALGCDFYAFSGHKMYGPTGIGVLYGREDLLARMEPYQGGGEMIKQVDFEQTIYNDLPYKFEAGTPDIAGAIGLGAAVDYLTQVGLDRIADHESALLEYASERAAADDDLRLIGTARNRAGILSFELSGVHPHDVGTILDHEGVAVRTGHHCAMPVMNRFGVPATARASFGMYNTHAEVDALFEGLAKVKEMFAR